MKEQVEVKRDVAGRGRVPGQTWAQIGESLGFTRQAVQVRLGNIARFAKMGTEHHPEEHDGSRGT